MGERTGIAWTDHTFNPWRGCEKVSAGCTHCYAETLSKRNPAVLGEWGPNGRRAIASESYWREPIKWNRQAAKDGVRRKVFCLSLGDVAEDRPELAGPRLRLGNIIRRTQSLDWLLLTKRPENLRRALLDMGFGDLRTDPLPSNVWLGGSCEDQPSAERVLPALLRVPAAVHFASYEPALAAVDLTPWLYTRFRTGDGRHGTRSLTWVIVGGESGKGARPFNLEWARSTVRDCLAAGVACFVKQIGADPIMEPGPVSWPTTHPKGADPSEWPEALRIQEFPAPSPSRDLFGGAA